jgi:hypothetical protein
MQIFFSTLEQWFWHFWDHLWRLLGWNLVLFFASIPVLTLGESPAASLLPIAWWIVILGPLITGTVSWAWPMAEDRSPGLADLLHRLRRTYPRAVALHALFAGLVAIIALNLHFYLGEAGQRALGHVGSLLLSGVTLWIGVFLVILWLWAQVALGEDRAEGPRSLLGALRQSGRIVLFHPVLSLGHLVTVALFTCAMFRTQVGVIFLWPTAVAVYLSTAVFEMYYAAEAKAEKARAEAAQSERKPTSWREIIQDETPGGHGPYAQRPRRSLREILRPWEM